MFSYYERSNKCYAFLDDVDGNELSKQFPRSRWFTRGWTLQELIAPQSVIFYDRNWAYLGRRNGDLLQPIYAITKVPKEVLRVSDFTTLKTLLRHTSLAARMSWAATRKTSRIEDIAYCLLGIFDINMPLLYGEGEKAFARLQEEIIKTSTDHSIFCWNRPRAGASNLLARFPSDFDDGGQIQACDREIRMESYAMTNRGLTITLPVVNEVESTREVDVALNCTVDRHTQILFLKPVDNSDLNFGTMYEYIIEGWAMMDTELDYRQSQAKKRTLVILRQFPVFEATARINYPEFREFHERNSA